MNCRTLLFQGTTTTTIPGDSLWPMTVFNNIVDDSQMGIASSLAHHGVHGTAAKLRQQKRNPIHSDRTRCPSALSSHASVSALPRTEPPRPPATRHPNGRLEARAIGHSSPAWLVCSWKRCAGRPRSLGPICFACSMSASLQVLRSKACRPAQDDLAHAVFVADNDFVSQRIVESQQDHHLVHSSDRAPRPPTIRASLRLLGSLRSRETIGCRCQDRTRTVARQLCACRLL